MNEMFCQSQGIKYFFFDLHQLRAVVRKTISCLHPDTKPNPGSSEASHKTQIDFAATEITLLGSGQEGGVGWQFAIT